MDRIETLKQFVDQNPDDPFPRYGLAMAYTDAGDLDAARAVFAVLLERSPGYVATYLMYGNMLADVGEPDAAADIYRRGIEAARAAGDSHAASELGGALAALAQTD